MANKQNAKKIQIFDTTLRDGEQSPGNSMNVGEKLRIAKQLERLGVDVIEAGFPIASEGDFEAVKLIAQTIKGPEIAGLCRASEKDIDRCWDAVQYAGERGRIHTFIATSPIHMQDKLKMSPDEVVVAAVKAVAYASSKTANIEFSLEDAGRSDIDFLVKVSIAVASAGAKVINIPDTVGYLTPAEYGAIFARIRSEVNPDVVLSAHCHNDLGLSVANSLAAIENGAGQVECTINGIGERAGNCSLEQLVMVMQVKKNFSYACNIKTELLVPTSQLLVSITGMMVQPNTPIVGANAFAHESGIHQDGQLKNAGCYEIMTPAEVGLNQSRLILGKHSGRNALKNRFLLLGHDPDKDKFEKVFKAFKDLADKKGEVFDEDLSLLMGIEPEAGRYQLEELTITCGTTAVATATVAMAIDGVPARTAMLGDGPVDSVFKAIRKLTKTNDKLERYNVGAITGGSDAQGEVTVMLSRAGIQVNGRAADVDIMTASAKAYINALNRFSTVSVKERQL